MMKFIRKGTMDIEAWRNRLEGNEASRWVQGVGVSQAWWQAHLRPALLRRPHRDQPWGRPTSSPYSHGRQCARGCEPGENNFFHSSFTLIEILTASSEQAKYAGPEGRFCPAGVYEYQPNDQVTYLVCGIAMLWAPI